MNISSCACNGKMMILLQVAPDIEHKYQHGFSKDRSKGAPIKYYQLLQVPPSARPPVVF